jgi:hypothetical protein
MPIALKSPTHAECVGPAAAIGSIIPATKLPRKTTDLATAKLMFNSVISTPRGRFMSIDLKDFYLCSDLEEYEYVRTPLHMLPEAIMDLNALHDKISKGHVYAEVRTGMYGLPQAGRLANEKLRTFLEPHEYMPCLVTPGLWKHLDSDLMFTLVVDDFSVRYTDRPVPMSSAYSKS